MTGVQSVLFRSVSQSRYNFVMDLNTEYYGNFKFQMHYKKISGPWFNWLYVDYETMHNQATELGFKSIMVTEENDHYLAQLQLS